MNKKHPSLFLERIETISRILSISAIPVMLALGGWLIQSSISKNTEKIKYIELATQILREPLQDNKPNLREWALKTLNHHSEIKFTTDEALILREGIELLPNNVRIMYDQKGRVVSVISDTESISYLYPENMDVKIIKIPKE